MKNQLTVTFNNQNYIATYNAQTGYYELELQAPGVGGIYKADINFTDLYEQEYEDSIAVQVLAKEKVKIEGLTLIPLKLYFKKNYIKVLVGICKGKKLYDKRQDLAKKDAERQIAYQLKNNNRH